MGGEREGGGLWGWLARKEGGRGGGGGERGNREGMAEWEEVRRSDAGVVGSKEGGKVKSETKICVPTEEDCEGKEEGGAGFF